MALDTPAPAAEPDDDELLLQELEQQTPLDIANNSTMEEQLKIQAVTNFTEDYEQHDEYDEEEDFLNYDMDDEEYNEEYNEEDY